MFKKHIRARLVATIAIMVLLLFSVNAYVSTRNVRNHFSDINDEKCIQESKYFAEKVDGWFVANEAILRTAADSAKVNVDDISVLRPIYGSVVDDNDAVSELYFVKDNNEMVFAHYIQNLTWIRLAGTCVSVCHWRLPAVWLV